MDSSKPRRKAGEKPGYRIKIPSKRDFRSCVIPAKAGRGVMIHR